MICQELFVCGITISPKPSSALKVFSINHGICDKVAVFEIAKVEADF